MWWWRQPRAKFELALGFLPLILLIQPFLSSQPYSHHLHTWAAPAEECAQASLKPSLSENANGGTRTHINTRMTQSIHRRAPLRLLHKLRQVACMTPGPSQQHRGQSLRFVSKRPRDVLATWACFVVDSLPSRYLFSPTHSLPHNPPTSHDSLVALVLALPSTLCCRPHYSPSP